MNEHVIKSFNTLFPSLNDSEIYAVEDTQTSYWPSLGEKWSNFGKGNVLLENLTKTGSSLDLNEPKTMMNMFKRLVDSLNYEEFLHPGYSPSYFDKHIVAIHFYHNLVIVYKTNNNSGSNIIENNTFRPFMLKIMGVESLEELRINFSSVDDPTNESTPL